MYSRIENMCESLILIDFTGLQKYTMSTNINFKYFDSRKNENKSSTVCAHFFSV